MANSDRQQIIDVEQLLLKNGREIPFVQVLRLLRFLLANKHDRDDRNDHVFEHIRIRPELSLDFPNTDVVSVEKKEQRSHDIFRITATFMGLYGSSSPLPTFYTEDLLEERGEESSITRDFLDIFNHPFYRHYFDIWEKYTPGTQLAENPNNKAYSYLYSLLGLSGEHSRQSLPSNRRLLAYIGLATQTPRSASGLRSIIADILEIDTVEVEQCVPYVAIIASDQRFNLGAKNSTLGEDSHLGSQVFDLMGKFRVRIKHLDSEQHRYVLPDADGYALIQESVKFYMDQPLKWDLELEIDEEEIQTCQPGNTQWGKLGWNTWVFSGNKIPNAGKVSLLGSIPE